MRARGGVEGLVWGEEVANKRCSLLKLANFLKSRHFSNVLAIGFSASSRQYQLDDINASKKLVSLINKNAFDLKLPQFRCYYNSLWFVNLKLAREFQ